MKTSDLIGDGLEGLTIEHVNVDGKGRVGGRGRIGGRVVGGFSVVAGGGFALQPAALQVARKPLFLA